jgi:YfiH family protein
MLEFSTELGEGVRAWMTGTSINPLLPASGDIFDEQTIGVLNSHHICSNQIFNIRQIHGGTVLTCVETVMPCKAEAVLEADGAVTNLRHVVLALRTADCIPVFLYDPVKRAIALVHAGWRSAEKRIVVAALEQMKENFGTDPQDVKVVLGPSIRSCCYEVGQEMCMVFPKAMISKKGKWFLDLQRVNRKQLIQTGVSEEKIIDIGLCTCCDERFFSYRRQGKKSGRHLSLLKIV